MLMLYTIGTFFRICALIFFMFGGIFLINAMIQVILQDIDSLPYEITWSFFLHPFSMLVLLNGLVSNIQITKYKLTFRSLFRKKELPRSELEEFTLYTTPGIHFYYFTVTLQSGKKVRFSLMPEECRDCVLEYLRGIALVFDDLEPETSALKKFANCVVGFLRGKQLFSDDLSSESP